MEKVASPEGTAGSDFARNAAILGIGGVGLGALAGGLSSVLSGGEYEPDKELARIKRRKRLQQSILGGAALGGLAGGGIAAADSIGTHALGAPKKVIGEGLSGILRDKTLTGSTASDVGILGGLGTAGGAHRFSKGREARLDKALAKRLAQIDDGFAKFKDSPLGSNSKLVDGVTTRVGNRKEVLNAARALQKVNPSKWPGRAKLLGLGAAGLGVGNLVFNPPQPKEASVKHIDRHEKTAVIGTMFNAVARPAVKFLGNKLFSHAAQQSVRDLGRGSLLEAPTKALADMMQRAQLRSYNYGTRNKWFTRSGKAPKWNPAPFEPNATDQGIKNHLKRNALNYGFGTVGGLGLMTPKDEWYDAPMTANDAKRDLDHKYEGIPLFGRIPFPSQHEFY